MPAPCCPRQLTTDHWPLTTDVCCAVVRSRRPLQESPKRAILQGRARTQPAGPRTRCITHLPPTMPRPQTMLTCSEPNVRILPPSNIPPSPACSNRKCSHQPSAAPPYRSGTVPAKPPMPAPPSPGSVSCHKEHSAAAVLRTFCTKTPSFAHFQSKTDRELTATASGYESPRQYPVTRTKENFSKQDRSGRNRAFRYPIDTLPILDFRNTCSLFASHLDALGPILDRIGHILSHMRG